MEVDMAFGIDDALILLGGAKTLFGGKQDPYADIRKQYQALLKQYQTQFPRMRSAITFRGGQQQGDLMNMLGSRGAAAGLPENVVQQNMNRAFVNAGQNTNEALANLDMQQNQAMANLAGMTLATPPKPVDTWGEDLLGTGIQMLLANKNPNGEDGGFDVLGWLKGLWGQGAPLSSVNTIRPNPLATQRTLQNRNAYLYNKALQQGLINPTYPTVGW
jgi:hypothetical protein